MSKWLRNVALMALMLFIFPVSTSAFELIITDAKIDAYLQPDGNVEVKESFTYDFDGEFNGVVRTLNHREESLIIGVEAFENGDSLPIVTEEEIVHYIHRSGEDEEITIDIHYTIENGVEGFSDLGQFYWPFFDSNNETDYVALTVSVYPPNSSEQVQAIGYDSAANSEMISDDGSVTFSMGYVESGENGDIRAAFDADLFPGVSRSSNETVGDQIINEHDAREEQAVIFAERRELISDLSLIFIPVLSLIFLLLMANEWLNNRRRRISSVYQYKSPGIIPELIISMPATIMILHPMVSADMLAASLLDLVRQKKVEKISDDSFRVVNRSGLLDHESLLISWLFDEIGNEDVFRFSDMTSFLDNEDNHDQFQLKQTEWSIAVKKELADENLKINKTKFRWGLGLTACSLAPVSVLLIIYDLIIPFIFMSTVILVVILFALIFQPRTEKGWKISQEWKAFKQKLKNLTVKDWKELNQEEQMKAFIFGLGTNVKAIKDMGEDLTNQLSLVSSKQTQTAGDQSFDISNFILLGLVFSNGFQTSSAKASSSISSSSGGIGGGTGVGGGGGGSGGF